MADLDLSKKGSGDLRLGSEPAVNPSDVRPIATRSADPLIDFSNAPGRSLALVAGDFLSGYLGQGAGQVTAGAAGARQRAEQLKNQRLMRSLELGANLAKTAQGLPEGPKREKYISTIEDTLAKAGDKDTISIVRSMVFDHPDVDFSLYENVPEFKALVSTGATPAQQVAWMQSKEGLAAYKEHQTATVTPVAMDKLSAITQDIDKLHREGLVPTELYNRVTKDGKMTFQDAVAISNALPEAGADQYRLEPNEISAATGAADQWATAGLATAEDFDTDIKGTSQNIVNSKNEIVGQLVFTEEGSKVQMPGGELRDFASGEFIGDVGLGAGDISNGDIKTLEDVNTLFDIVVRSERITELKEDDFLGLEGKVSGGLASLADQFGVEIPEGATKKMAFDAVTAGMRNVMLKIRSGGAVTDGEAERALAELPTSDDGPVRFQQKLNEFQDSIKMFAYRAREAVKQGKKPTEISMSLIQAKLDSGRAIEERIAELNTEGIPAEEMIRVLELEFPHRILNKVLGE
jgi:ribosomal protein S16